MPYYITGKNPECDGWAVVDGGDGFYGCHTTKTSAIKQAVAISLSTDEPFDGERAAVGQLRLATMSLGMLKTQEYWRKL
jgi:hypothetical protein